MKFSGRVIASLLAVLILGGCEGARKAIGLDKAAPDEFSVYTRAPLSLPPEYGLRPPAPGSDRPQMVNPRDIAKQAVLGTQSPDAAGTSMGVQALLRDTGALTSNPEIRASINRETSILALEDEGIAESILFWEKPGKFGRVVDPIKESQRIRENQALGRPLTEGETPTIERKRKGLLEDMFY
jgi:hypothetical protein